MTFKDIIKKNIIKYPYNYVPPCPRCSSYKTGKFVKSHGEFNDEYAIQKSLEAGELIKVVKELPSNNCYCANCGATWSYDIPVLMISYKKLIDQKEKRGTQVKLDNYVKEINKKQTKTRKWMKRYLY